MPLSKDPERRAAQLANLRNAPPAPLGHQRAASPFLHRSEMLVRDVEAEVRELMDALGDAAPVREPDGSVPAADVVAIEVAARALKRYRHVSRALDTFGRFDPDTGKMREAAVHEPRFERALTEALNSLGMTPASRAKLGVDLARTMDLAQQWAREAIEGEESDG